MNTIVLIVFLLLGFAAYAGQAKPPPVKVIEGTTKLPLGRTDTPTLNLAGNPDGTIKLEISCDDKVDLEFLYSQTTDNGKTWDTDGLDNSQCTAAQGTLCRWPGFSKVGACASKQGVKSTVSSIELAHYDRAGNLVPFPANVRLRGTVVMLNTAAAITYTVYLGQNP